MEEYGVINVTSFTIPLLPVINTSTVIWENPLDYALLFFPWQRQPCIFRNRVHNTDILLFIPIQTWTTTNCFIKFGLVYRSLIFEIWCFLNFASFSLAVTAVTKLLVSIALTALIRAFSPLLGRLFALYVPYEGCTTRTSQ